MSGGLTARLEGGPWGLWSRPAGTRASPSQGHPLPPDPADAARGPTGRHLEAAGLRGLHPPPGGPGSGRGQGRGRRPVAGIRACQSNEVPTLLPGGDKGLSGTGKGSPVMWGRSRGSDPTAGARPAQGAGAGGGLSWFQAGTCLCCARDPTQPSTPQEGNRAAREAGAAPTCWRLGGEAPLRSSRRVVGSNHREVQGPHGRRDGDGTSPSGRGGAWRPRAAPSPAGCPLTRPSPPGADHHPLHWLPGPHLLLLLRVLGREGRRQRGRPRGVRQLRGRPVVGSGRSAAGGRSVGWGCAASVPRPPRGLGREGGRMSPWDPWALASQDLMPHGWGLRAPKPETRPAQG